MGSFSPRTRFGSPVPSDCHLNVQVANLSIGMNQLAWSAWHRYSCHQSGGEGLSCVAQNCHRGVGEGEAQVEGGRVVQGATLRVLHCGNQSEVSVAVGGHSACLRVGLWLF